MDKLSPEHRSWNMSRIKGKDTEIEKVTRSVLHRMGKRFRKNKKGLAGKPDIVMTGYKTVIFVHGCYWHRHKGCKDTTSPKTNVKKWSEKFEGNVKRDKRNIKTLEKDGWNVGIIWGCQTKNRENLEKRLQKIIDESGGYIGKYKKVW
jgi:DNA mismatch endonuclease, patch repair protein